MSPNNNNKEKDDRFFERPAGILVDQEQWLFLRERYHMTPRELQVAILVCRGFNNEEIAKALKIRYGTVKTHLRNLYRRVRVKSKILLLLKFIEDINSSNASSKPDKLAVPISEIPQKTNTTSDIYHKEKHS